MKTDIARLFSGVPGLNVIAGHYAAVDATGPSDCPFLRSDATPPYSRHADRIHLAMLRILLLLVLGVSLHAEEGFEPLFDGSTLNGWVLLGQQGGGYTASDGVLACSRGSGGNLMSAAEYSDFVLRFEFRLESGSNNGLCIRCPLAWRALAYDGNELQIIDNSAERYRNIKPWQRHGSLYHVAAAKPGALRPVGEWNSQEVTVRGTRIRVVLNGTEILDTDTSEIKDRSILAQHPGLARKSGHIGFLGHNEPVEFRNIRIKQL